MDDEIASMSLLGISRDGRESAIEIRVGKPRPAGDDWACRVSVTGSPSGTKDYYGVDSIQALQLGLFYVKFYLTDFVSRGGQLLYAGGREPFPLSAYFPELPNSDPLKLRQQ